MADPLTVAVHRCRFVDYDPSPVTALAFPPLPIPSSAKGKKPAQVNVGMLAVGHANGDIDLCDWSGDSNSKQAHQAWVVRRTISGPYPSKVDTLVFALRDPDSLAEDQVPTYFDLRLFSSGGGSDLLEWDLNRGCLRRTIGSLGGSIWSVACNPTSTTLALGCEDGTIRLLNIADDTLTHLRRFDKVKCRILSLAWGPPKIKKQSKDAPKASSDSESEEEEEEWEDSFIVSGGSDSALRKWNVNTGRVLEKMGTDKIKGEQTLVWTVGVLGDGTIVSGDSMGLVKFWDSRTCTQLQSFRAHDADVLCLTLGSEGTSVYTSGVDQKVTQFNYVKESNPPPSILSSSSKWVQSCSRRLHSHDVRALAIWPPHTPLPPLHKRKYPLDVAPILASGGLDMSVVVTPAALTSTTSLLKVTNPLATSSDSTFEEAYQRKLAYPPGPSGSRSVCIAKEARLIGCMRDSGASFWRILPRQDDEDVSTMGDEWEKVLDMDFDVSTNLSAVALSDDGRWLALSDWYSSKLYELRSTSEGVLKPKRLKEFSSVIQTSLQNSPTNAGTGAVSFCFTPDSKKLVIATTESYVLIVDLTESLTVLRKFDHHHTPKTHAYVSRLSVSPDGQWVASSDDLGRTNVYNVDTLQHQCLLPTFPHPAQAISFDPHRPSLLILAFPNNTLQFYDVESRTFPTWCKNLTDSLSPRFSLNHDPVMGVTFDPSPKADYALFWGSTWLCKIRLDESQSKATAKRRRDLVMAGRGDEDQYGASGKDFKMITSYRPILGVEFLSEGEMVIVERPLVDVLAKLPPAYFKHRYGRS